MPKKSSSTPKGKLADKTVALVGKFGYSNHDLGPMVSIVPLEGGTVVDGLSTAADLLVQGDGVGGKPPAAVAKIQKKHPQTQVIDQTTFYQLVCPTADEFRELMCSGIQEEEFWNGMNDRLRQAGQMLDLSGSNFRKLKIEGNLSQICFDHSDFRGAIVRASFEELRGVNFDGATLERCRLKNAEDCSFKKAAMTAFQCLQSTFHRCDFSAAKMDFQFSFGLTANHCSFQKADLTKVSLSHSKFIDCDFSGATLQDARLEQCRFTGSNLSKANFSGADLRKVDFTNADLRKTIFRNAWLVGADLSKALIDGADFTGANLALADVTGLDCSKAKNLIVMTARAVGPHLAELAKIASASRKFATMIDLDLEANEYVTLCPTLIVYPPHLYPRAAYSHQTPGREQSVGQILNNQVDAPSFERGILNLADLWHNGTPKFNTINVEATKCPLRGKELKDLVTAAWYEVFGLPVPTSEELEQQEQKYLADAATVREIMLVELHGGSAGVQQWNNRSKREREQLGKLRKHNFAKGKLSEVDLSGQSLEGCIFEGADLKKANLRNTQLKGADFKHANLSGANLASAKPAEASFEEANLKSSTLRAASFRRCSFKNANLSQADFSYSDLGGADFSGAILENVEYCQTKFDEKTIFPDGYTPPEGLVWKGIGPRPGTVVLPPPQRTGTLNFETFLQQLNDKVELARMQKAGSMLKAERFQLFADVKDNSLVGIVKSQSNRDLVYSCRLAADGAFGCCTQNLRPCGGLRGALCKHLLVLIIGLAQAGELDSATVDHWIDLSRNQKPAIDEDSMSATFLKYKGAEAGEIDWRPTETIPEDFYTL